MGKANLYLTPFELDIIRSMLVRYVEDDKCFITRTNRKATPVKLFNLFYKIDKVFYSKLKFY